MGGNGASNTSSINEYLFLGNEEISQNPTKVCIYRKKVVILWCKNRKHWDFAIENRRNDRLKKHGI